MFQPAWSHWIELHQEEQPWDSAEGTGQLFPCLSLPLRSVSLPQHIHHDSRSFLSHNNAAPLTSPESWHSSSVRALLGASQLMVCLFTGVSCLQNVKWASISDKRFIFPHLHISVTQWDKWMALSCFDGSERGIWWQVDLSSDFGLAAWWGHKLLTSSSKENLWC